MLELIGLFWKSDIIDKATGPSSSCYSLPLNFLFGSFTLLLDV